MPSCRIAAKPDRIFVSKRNLQTDDAGWCFRHNDQRRILLDVAAGAKDESKQMSTILESRIRWPFLFMNAEQMQLVSKILHYPYVLRCWCVILLLRSTSQPSPGLSLEARQTLCGGWRWATAMKCKHKSCMPSVIDERHESVCTLLSRYAQRNPDMYHIREESRMTRE